MAITAAKARVEKTFIGSSFLSIDKLPRADSPRSIADACVDNALRPASQGTMLHTTSLHKHMTPTRPATHTIRIWDLPTRLFHWLLALCIVALVVTAKLGGNAMNWHLILGQVVLALLIFRLLWALVGGYWSRLMQLLPSPSALSRYLRGAAHVSDRAGHNPLGAFRADHAHGSDSAGR